MKKIFLLLTAILTLMAANINAEAQTCVGFKETILKARIVPVQSTDCISAFIGVEVPSGLYLSPVEAPANLEFFEGETLEGFSFIEERNGRSIWHAPIPIAAEINLCNWERQGKGEAISSHRIQTDGKVLIVYAPGMYEAVTE